MRERQPQVGRHAGPGGIGKSRDGGERAVGVQEGEASFQRRKGEEPPLEQRHVQVEKERDGTLDSDLPPQRVTQTLIPTTHSPLITDHQPQTRLLTHHVLLKAVGGSLDRLISKQNPFLSSEPRLAPQETAGTLHPTHTNPRNTDRLGPEWS